MCSCVKIKCFMKIHLIYLMRIHFLTENGNETKYFVHISFWQFVSFRFQFFSCFQNEKRHRLNGKFQRFLDFMFPLSTTFWPLPEIARFSKMSQASFQGASSLVTFTLSSCDSGGHSNTTGSFLLFWKTCPKFIPGRMVCVIFLGHLHHRHG